MNFRKKINQKYNLNRQSKSLNQTWMKDVGYDESPNYKENLGLPHLEDFLQVTSKSIDFVKICTDQVLKYPENWIKKKVLKYKKYNIKTYLDHTYFLEAYNLNSVEEAIIYGSQLGFDYFEFMSTYNDIPDKDLLNWINICKRNNLKILYEHHPEKNWSSKNNNFTNSDKIISMLKIFFENDAEKLVLDHDEFELQSNHEVNNYNEIISYLSLDKICFEVTSPKEGETIWIKNLEDYFKLFGFNINVSNIMPSQVLYVNKLRLNSKNC